MVYNGRWPRTLTIILHGDLDATGTTFMDSDWLVRTPLGVVA